MILVCPHFLQYRSELMIRVARYFEAAFFPLAGLLAGLGIFSLFLLAQGISPVQFFQLVWLGGFGTAFSWQNTLSRAVPLLLAGLCVAIPVRLGLIVVGGEGAIVMGGIAAASVALLLVGLPGWLGVLLMAGAAALIGALWIGAVGALRHWRGVNETIASLLLAFIAIALMNHLVEGPLRDPASLNTPATPMIDPAFAIGAVPMLNIHWGLVFAVLACVATWIVMERTSWGFAARIIGENQRAAVVQGLPVGWLVLGFTAFGGAMAGMAGYFEVAAVQGAANSSLAAGYGFTGILVAFLARHNALMLIPAAILLAGFEASSGLLQRRMELPDATILVMQGFIFVAILVTESLQVRIRHFLPESWRRE